MRAMRQRKPPRNSVSTTPMNGSASLETASARAMQAASVSRDFGPASAQPAHCSDTEVACTFNSGQRVCSNSSSQAITVAAWAVVVVMKYSLSDSRQVVPSSSTNPSSRSMMP